MISMIIMIIMLMIMIIIILFIIILTISLIICFSYEETCALQHVATLGHAAKYRRGQP